MKKIIKIVASLILLAGTLALVPACGGGTAEVEYTLSDDGTHYIVSGVSGTKSALYTYDVMGTYANSQTGEELPVTEIGEKAFMDCKSLYRITLPEGIEKISELAFMRCTFSEIVLPESLKEISRAAFGMCTNLAEIVIPENVTTLSAQSFAYCSSLEKVYIKGAITVLPELAFVNSVVATGSGYYTDTSLTEVYLPETLQKISSSALSGNYISDIYFSGTQEQWDALYFYDTDTDDDGNLIETKVEKSTVIGSVEVHVGYSY